MKILKTLGQRLLLTASGLLVGASVSFAAGGGATGGAAGGAAGGGGHGGGAAVGAMGGGHAGGASFGAAHASGTFAGGSAGFRSPGVGAAGFHSTGLMNSSLRASTYGVNGGLNRVTGAGFGTGAFHAGSPSAVGAGGFGTLAGSRNSLGQAGLTRNQVPAARVNNAWSDPYPSRAANVGTAQSATAGAYHNGYYGYDQHLGQNLYPGAAGYNSTVVQNGFRHGGNNGNYNHGNGYHHRYYNNFPYFVYYPYLYNNFGYGDYGFGGYGGYVGTADYAGLTNDSIADYSLPSYGNNPNYYYNYDTPAPTAAPQDGGDQPAAQPSAPLPDATDVGPQSPTAAPTASSRNPSKGPDSLVEAVQSELARRGYYEGNPDAMYSDATKEAIRRFQTDQHLPATGRINEATLHALKLD